MNSRVAIITGGEGDLARACAQQLADTGMRVLSPGRGELDVANPASVEEFFSRIEQVDLLLNNAAIRADAFSGRMTEQQWDDVIAIDLRGAFLCAQAAAKLMMKQRSGHIINVGSFAARFGNTGQTNYAAAKAGMIGLTQSMARELGKRNVRVNCVLPGFLETKFTAGMAKEFKEQALAMHSLGKFNTVEEAARFIAFLDGMQFVSGQVFQLDSRVAPWT